MDKTDSNWRKTIDVSPVRSVVGFELVQKCLTDLPNVNGIAMNMPNVKHI